MFVTKSFKKFICWNILLPLSCLIISNNIGNYAFMQDSIALNFSSVFSIIYIIYAAIIKFSDSGRVFWYHDILQAKHFEISTIWQKYTRIKSIYISGQVHNHVFKILLD